MSLFDIARLSPPALVREARQELSVETLRYMRDSKLYKLARLRYQLERHQVYADEVVDYCEWVCRGY